MARSLKASVEGLKKAQSAFNLKGKTQEYLAGSVGCTRQVIINFFARRTVAKRFFQAICTELGLEWGEISELDEDFQPPIQDVDLDALVRNERDKVSASIQASSLEPILIHSVDVSRLKEMAIDAECDRDIERAIRLWEQIILLPTIDTTDRQLALNRIRDLMSRSSQSPTVLEPLPEIELSQPETYERAIDAVPLKSEKGVDYRTLRDLLKAGKWREANEETLKVMLKAANRESESWLNADSLKKFPCKDLKTIDRLWVTASNGLFGFSVQKKIWEECGCPMSYSGKWEKFLDLVGWKKNREWLSNFDLKLSLDFSPRGELPSADPLGIWLGGLGLGRERGSLFSRKDL
jgi:transcriptional regulator with XRE-family HTH domain